MRAAISSYVVEGFAACTGGAYKQRSPRKQHEDHEREPLRNVQPAESVDRSHQLIQASARARTPLLRAIFNVRLILGQFA
jgi:hypothetical protein